MYITSNAGDSPNKPTAEWSPPVALPRATCEDPQLPRHATRFVGLVLPSK